ncbi:MAG: motif [Myxococcaceae bacterium]|nr:motif [Myxococcaceae bacterium]
MSFLSGLVSRVLLATGLKKKPAAMPKRSDPCPCGSGKTFKDCHLPQVLKEARAAKGKT